MRIQIISHNKEKDSDSGFRMRWHWLPFFFEESGHEVDHVLKQDWKSFYFRYLKFKPDIVISVGPIAIMPSFLKKMRLMRAPHIHDWTDDYVDVNGKTNGLAKMALYEYFTVENADYITTPSIFKKERCELWEKPVFYIPHGVDPDFDEKEPAKLDGRTKIFYGGEQSKRKRVDRLIGAVKDIDCELYLFGKTNEEFKMNASPNVHFMGHVNYTEFPRYLKAADILVLTADDDCTLKMFEYIKTGKTILGIRGRVNYVLTHRENAYLTDDLAKGLKELIEHEELRNQLANNVRTIKIYTWKEVATQYMKFLERVVNDKHG
jgi:glycosyltransferase involved in cell wall biosynthesis